jgi:serine/threonine-protein phosphatase PP1 catalytic subunit
MFNFMPLCAIINQQIICVHGGLSPELEEIEQLNKLQKPLEIFNQGIPTDLLWSDP